MMPACGLCAASLHGTKQEDKRAGKKEAKKIDLALQ
jgi:hypothetical protein